MDLYIAVWYGEEMNLLVIQDGHLERKIDLHPYVTMKIEDTCDITFDVKGDSQIIYLNPKKKKLDDDDGKDNEKLSLSSEYTEDIHLNDEQTEATGKLRNLGKKINMRIRYPELTGTLIDPEDSVDVERSWFSGYNYDGTFSLYCGRTFSLRYGMNDLE